MQILHTTFLLFHIFARNNFYTQPLTHRFLSNYKCEKHFSYVMDQVLYHYHLHPQCLFLYVGLHFLSSFWCHHSVSKFVNECLECLCFEESKSCPKFNLLQLDLFLNSTCEGNYMLFLMVWLFLGTKQFYSLHWPIRIAMYLITLVRILIDYTTSSFRLRFCLFYMWHD